MKSPISASAGNCDGHSSEGRGKSAGWCRSLSQHCLPNSWKDKQVANVIDSQIPKFPQYHDWHPIRHANAASSRCVGGPVKPRAAVQSF